MTTSEINSQRLDLVREPVASLLLELTKRFVLPQRRKRIIAIGRCERGGAFTATAHPEPPADFADAIDEVLRPDRVPTVRNMADCEDEHIGAELCEAPYNW
jgi:hypothetical protein